MHDIERQAIGDVIARMLPGKTFVILVATPTDTGTSIDVWGNVGGGPEIAMGLMREAVAASDERDRAMRRVALGAAAEKVRKLGLEIPPEMIP